MWLFPSNIAAVRVGHTGPYWSFLFHVNFTDSRKDMQITIARVNNQRRKLLSFCVIGEVVRDNEQERSRFLVSARIISTLHRILEQLELLVRETTNTSNVLQTSPRCSNNIDYSSVLKLTSSRRPCSQRCLTRMVKLRLKKGYFFIILLKGYSIHVNCRLLDFMVLVRRMSKVRLSFH